MLVFRRSLAATDTVAPALPALRAVVQTDVPAQKLGTAVVPQGVAPAVGPAKSDIAAE
jgi:hypothetical protein